ncbi:DMT family transporter [Shewanella sp. NIFS-20-20]|uniref:DMT family transporter n=1 Tax=Shewanella sp. NIFS-20-20 TaxID=2853806 RepID=UPI001C45CD2F|nr:DMT family transporter [Shewanella sp. NIFS-20-20]MBV7315486.1 DMT family transporter [Shewanella sp. NIFS-20-20]
MTDQQRGLWLAFAGIMILSFDSLLVRLIGGSPWDLLFWRGALQATSLLFIQLLCNRDELVSDFTPPTKLVLLAGILFAASTICFVESLDHTQVASTLVIVNTAPLFTALLALLLLKEKIERPTQLAIAIAVSGIWLIFAFAPGQGQWVGNLYALFTAMSTAIYLVIMRKTKGQHAANFLINSGILIALFSLYKGASPLSVSQSQFIYLVILGGVVVPSAYLCISKSPAYIPAAQTSFILLAEVLLGPLYVYLFIGDVPSNNDLTGGAIILLTLGVHTIWQIRHHQMKT